MGVALYFLDKLALRAGHEKDEDEADTVRGGRGKGEGGDADEGAEGQEGERERGGGVCCVLVCAYRVWCVLKLNTITHPTHLIHHPITTITSIHSITITQQVGCCTLKVENVECVPPSQLKFDFLGKDSIRYENTVDVDPKVYAAVETFLRVDERGKRELLLLVAMTMMPMRRRS